MKKAILAVSYGTANAAARERSIDAWETALAKAFPDYDVRRAFTGKRICEILRKQGNPVDSVKEALERLAAEGYDEVAVQPSHIIGGCECDSIRDTVASLRGCFSKLVMGKPLLSCASDLEIICRLLYQTFGGDESQIVVMGHGTEHRANHIYADLGNTCRTLGYTNIHIATLESTPNLDDLLPTLKASGQKNITLTPLLFAAGDHACRDMAGDGPDSWKSVLTDEGFCVTAVVKGLGEYEEIRALYVAHLKAALSCE